MNRLNALLFVVAGGLIAAAVPIRGTETVEDEEERWQRFSQSCASASLKTLTAPEADFRGCDGDWNHVDDFWTTDVKALYTMTSAAVQPTEPPNPSDDAPHGCHVNDFWSADVKGLYSMESAAVAGRDPETVRSVPIEYWDGIGPWHGNLWMLYRMCGAAQGDPAAELKLIESSIKSADGDHD